MAENSKIEWTEHTFNPWIGCTKVSPGCANCYAETQDKFRSWTPDGWGKGKPRRRTSVANWLEPVKWNRQAAVDQQNLVDGQIYRNENGLEPYHRPRVFCASLADWLDDEVPIEWLADLLALIHATPNLDWLMLTKRPQLWRRRINAAMVELDERGENIDSCALTEWIAGNPPANVWLGTSVEDQLRADERIPLLLEIPARVRFLSCEPLLGPVDLTMALEAFQTYAPDLSRNPAPVQWVIAGGESGSHARPMHPDWARSLRDQCAAAGVPFLFKQWGEWEPTNNNFDWRAKRQFLELNGRDSTNWEIDRHSPGTANMQRVGKARAGRTLDGLIHDAFPTH